MVFYSNYSSLAKLYFGQKFVNGLLKLVIEDNCTFVHFDTVGTIMQLFFFRLSHNRVILNFAR